MKKIVEPPIPMAQVDGPLYDRTKLHDGFGTKRC